MHPFERRSRAHWLFFLVMAIIGFHMATQTSAYALVIGSMIVVSAGFLIGLISVLTNAVMGRQRRLVYAVISGCGPVVSVTLIAGYFENTFLKNLCWSGVFMATTAAGIILPPRHFQRAGEKWPPFTIEEYDARMRLLPPPPIPRPLRKGERLKFATILFAVAMSWISSFPLRLVLDSLHAPHELWIPLRELVEGFFFVWFLLSEGITRDALDTWIPLMLGCSACLIGSFLFIDEYDLTTALAGGTLSLCGMYLAARRRLAPDLRSLIKPT